MRIDETHRPWMFASSAIFTVALLVYVPYALWTTPRPTGGSAVGLLYGIIGFGMMIFAGLLSMRKKFRVARIGRAKTWMKGHLWLGFLAYPLILFHAAFRLGGSLTTAMMIIFTFVFVSGIAGAALQHYMPMKMTHDVPMETIYDQIDSVMGQLVREAADIMSHLVPALEAVPVTDVVGERTITLHAAAREVDSKDLQPLRTLYEEKLLPYLLQRGSARLELANPQVSDTIFEQVRKMSPTAIDPFVDDLQSICDEKRQLDKQSRMHRILHGWLFVHIPLSWALLVMGMVHAVIALRY
jgi:hypothetical protein